MFNEEYKNEFLKSVTDSEAVYAYFKRLFAASEQYETEFDKDLCEFTDDEMSKFYSERSRMRRSSNITLQSSLKKYLDYSVASGCNVVCDIKTVFGSVSGNEQKMRSKMAFGPQHLNTYMDAVFGKVKDRTAGIRLRCFLWMAFFGMNYRDAVTVSNDDVDLANKVIVKGGNEYLMCDEAIEAFYLARSLTEFAVINPLTPGKCVHNERHSGNLILRGTKNSRSGSDKCDGGISDIKQEVNRKIAKAIADKKVTSRITYDTAKLSGLFYRMYLRELAGIKPAFKTIAISDVKTKGSLSESKRKFDKKVVETIRNYESDYELWKGAYDMYCEDSRL